MAGKGGVGRTALAAAIALRSARQGARTLLLEVNTPDNAARALKVAPSVDDPRQVLDNLWLCRMTPAGAMREYALMVLKFRALYNLVFENRMVKFLLRSIPSLAEFTMSGKAWFHSVEKLKNGEPKYQRIIIDAPATGHAITLLSVSRVVADTVPPGIMKNASEKMALLLENHQTTCLHVVALPEEMPVNEALDLVHTGRERLRMAPGLAFMNRLAPALFSAPEASLIASLEGEDVAPFVSLARRRGAIEKMQNDHLRRFKEKSGMALIVVPEIPHGEERDLVEKIVEVLDREAGTTPLAKAADA